MDASPWPALPPAPDDDQPALEGELLPPGTYEKLASHEPYPKENRTPGSETTFGFAQTRTGASNFTWRVQPSREFKTQDTYRAGGRPVIIFDDVASFHGTDYGNGPALTIKVLTDMMGRVHRIMHDPAGPDQ